MLRRTLLKIAGSTGIGGVLPGRGRAQSSSNDKPGHVVREYEWIRDQLEGTFDTELVPIWEGFDAVDDGDILWDNRDAQYWLEQKQVVKRRIEDVRSYTRPYETDRYDCEDFADHVVHEMNSRNRVNQVGKINCFGDFDDRWHAFNVAIFPDGSIEFYEPIEGEWIDPDAIEDAEHANEWSYDLSRNGGIVHL